ncbi:hypothetical protein C8R46DRAFT_1234405 [Mycena filopes]|nr:hypothetical protein C8R46DRAFT_1234405 [Mycena filopes]
MPLDLVPPPSPIRRASRVICPSIHPGSPAGPRKLAQPGSRIRPHAPYALKPRHRATGAQTTSSIVEHTRTSPFTPGARRVLSRAKGKHRDSYIRKVVRDIASVSFVKGWTEATRDGGNEGGGRGMTPRLGLWRERQGGRPWAPQHAHRHALLHGFYKEYRHLDKRALPFAFPIRRRTVALRLPPLDANGDPQMRLPSRFLCPPVVQARCGNADELFVTSDSFIRIVSFASSTGAVGHFNPFSSHVNTRCPGPFPLTIHLVIFSDLISCMPCEEPQGCVEVRARFVSLTCHLRERSSLSKVVTYSMPIR